MSTSFPKILGKLNGFPKKKNIEKPRASLGKKKSIFLGNLPSQQIFHRNIPLGSPDTGKSLFLLSKSFFTAVTI